MGFYSALEKQLDKTAYMPTEGSSIYPLFLTDISY